MARRFSKLEPGLTPKDLHDILNKELGVGLFRFAQAFAASFNLANYANIWPTYETLKKQRRILAKLRSDIIHGLLGLVPPDSPQTKVIAGFTEDLGLKRLFDMIDKKESRIKFWEKEKREVGLKKKGIGPGPNVKSLIAAGWGILTNVTIKKSSWPLLADLYEWFWARVDELEAYKEARPPDDLVSYLSIQYFRYKKSEWPSLFVRHLLSDGITTLGRDWLDDDPTACEIVLWALSGRLDMPQPEDLESEEPVLKIYESHGIDLSPWEKSAHELLGLPWEKENEKLRDLVKRLPRLPPLIVFPDGSYFSTAF